jgi:hypothetical protein
MKKTIVTSFDQTTTTVEWSLSGWDWYLIAGLVFWISMMVVNT